MTLRYGSVCSGIEAATMAWHPLGWLPVFFAEIAKFPSALLAARWPGVPNVGDFARPFDHDAIDLLVGGTPCQSFSVAGLRGGLADERGNLALEFLRLAQRARPRWVVWENVPGVLSSNGGRDFGAILGGLAELGYGFAYRVLDAQFFGVPQRRRRAFVVGCAGGWPAAAAVLFERASLRGDPAPSRAEGTEVAGSLGGGSESRGRRGDLDANGGYVPEIAHALRAQPQSAHDGSLETYVAWPAAVAPTLDATYGTKRGLNDQHIHCQGAGLFVPAIVFDEVQITSAQNRSNPRPGDPAPTLSESSRHAIAFHHQQDPIDVTEASLPLGAKTAGMGLLTPRGLVRRLTPRGLVRRLTPRECERLQGFPDDFTLISPKTADGPRYRALGNSMAVPVMRWIGERIAAVEAVLAARSEAA